MSNPRPVSETGTLVELGSVLDGRYRVDSFLGSGGYAEVFEGVQLNIGRRVAIKVLNSSGKRAAEFKARFFQEAQLAARIQHPNAVTIYDYGATPHGMPYMVFELLDGVTLRDLLDEDGPMAVHRALLLIVRCLEALDRAHDNGVIHRDLKPQNLFVVDPDTRAERLVILDFGLAYAMETKRRITAEGGINGTPRYLPPEYIQWQKVSPAMDVYQMGLILAEMVTGRSVVDEPNAYRCIMRHCQGNLEIPSWLTQSPLGPVLRRALATDHEVRLQTGGEFRDALEVVIQSLGMPMSVTESSEFALLRRNWEEHAAALGVSEEIATALSGVPATTVENGTGLKREQLESGSGDCLLSECESSIDGEEERLWERSADVS